LRIQLPENQGATHSVIQKPLSKPESALRIGDGFCNQFASIQSRRSPQLDASTCNRSASHIDDSIGATVFVGRFIG
jgi:hypothetical protein